MNQSLSDHFFDHKNLFIQGCTSEITKSFIKLILSQTKVNKIITTYRNEGLFRAEDFSKDIRVQGFELDATDELNWQKLVQNDLDSSIEFDLIFITAGFLHNEQLAPEKSIRDIDAKKAMHYFSQNTLPYILAVKYLHSFINKQSPSTLAVLSAKVASLAENKTGGWHSYRAAKVALNMYMKNFSIEFARKYPQLKVIAIHPGTVDTKMSKPFLKNYPSKILPPSECSQMLINLFENLKIEDSGQFLNIDGQILSW